MSLALCFLGLADVYSCSCPSSKLHGVLFQALQGFPAGSLSRIPLSKGFSIASGHLSSYFWGLFTPLEALLYRTQGRPRQAFSHLAHIWPTENIPWKILGEQANPNTAALPLACYQSHYQACPLLLDFPGRRWIQSLCSLTAMGTDLAPQTLLEVPCSNYLA